MVRIIAGSARGRTLKSFHGPGVRPTTDRVRESWFNMMGPRVIQSRFLDLYAGTGAVGIEALSRGASRCVLVEKSRQGAGIIRANLAVLDEEERDAAEVRQGEALPAIIMLARSGEQFDLIFADPPYEDTEAPGKVLATLAEAESLLAEGMLVTIQHTRHVSLPESAGRLRLQQTKRYGDTMLSMYALEKE